MSQEGLFLRVINSGFVLIIQENAGIYTNLISNKADLNSLEGDIMDTPSIFMFDKETRIQKLRGGILLRLSKQAYSITKQ